MGEQPDETAGSNEEEKPGKPIIDEPTEPALNPDDDDDFGEKES
ncbi:MAG: hypothetical protein ABR579_10150 [Actinomycetota bacterium]